MDEKQAVLLVLRRQYVMPAYSARRINYGREGSRYLCRPSRVCFYMTHIYNGLKYLHNKLLAAYNLLGVRCVESLVQLQIVFLA